MVMIPLNRIVIEQTVYPRRSRRWQTSYAYFQAMRAGERFPSVIVTKIGQKIYLVDGYHRIGAIRMLAETENDPELQIEVEYIKCRNLNDVYAEAVARNSTHGRPLTLYEKQLAYERLKGMGYKEATISRIVHIPVTELRKNIATAIVPRMTGNTDAAVVVAEEEPAGEQRPVPYPPVSTFTADRQLSLVKELIDLIKNGWMVFDDPRVAGALRQLKRLLSLMELKE